MCVIGYEDVLNKQAETRITSLVVSLDIGAAHGATSTTFNNSFHSTYQWESCASFLASAQDSRITQLRVDQDFAQEPDSGTC